MSEKNTCAYYSGTHARLQGASPGFMIMVSALSITYKSGAPLQIVPLCLYHNLYPRLLIFIRISPREGTRITVKIKW